MAGKLPSKEEISSVISAYLAKTPGVACEHDKEADTYLLKDPNGKEAVIGPGWKCSDDGLFGELAELLMNSREVVECPNLPTKPVGRANTGMAPRKAGNGALAKPGSIRDVQVADLTMEDIKAYICPTATDQETFMFLKLCQARNLNPFLKEAYLIKYDHTKPAQMVVGKDKFTKTAEEHPQFDGFRAGIIISSGEELIEREGTFIRKGEVLEGGWAEIFRKDRKLPFKQSVSLREFDKGMANWKTMPATMIRKCALVQALRECFPSDLAGCYDRDEMGLNPDNEVAA